MNQQAHLSDVTVLIVTKETDVTSVLLVTMETYVVSFSNVIGERNLVKGSSKI